MMMTPPPTTTTTTALSIDVETTTLEEKMMTPHRQPPEQELLNPHHHDDALAVIWQHAAASGPGTPIGWPNGVRDPSIGVFAATNKRSISLFRMSVNWFFQRSRYQRQNRTSALPRTGIRRKNALDWMLWRRARVVWRRTE
jgi:hypothetical protein